jgi:hypothetical protein
VKQERGIAVIRLYRLALGLGMLVVLGACEIDRTRDSVSQRPEETIIIGPGEIAGPLTLALRRADPEWPNVTSVSIAPIAGFALMCQSTRPAREARAAGDLAAIPDLIVTYRRLSAPEVAICEFNGVLIVQHRFADGSGQDGLFVIRDELNSKATTEALFTVIATEAAELLDAAGLGAEWTAREAPEAPPET